MFWVWNNDWPESHYLLAGQCGFFFPAKCILPLSSVWLHTTRFAQNLLKKVPTQKCTQNGPRNKVKGFDLVAWLQGMHTESEYSCESLFLTKLLTKPPKKLWSTLSKPDVNCSAWHYRWFFFFSYDRTNQMKTILDNPALNSATLLWTDLTGQGCLQTIWQDPQVSVLHS